MSASSTRNNLPVSRSPVTMADLLADLLWPRLLRSAAMALSAPRMGLALAATTLVFALDRVGGWIFTKSASVTVPGPIETLLGKIAEGVGKVLSALHNVDGRQTAAALRDLFIRTPMDLVRNDWAAVLVVMAPAVAVYAVIGGAICRSAACETSQNVRLTWVQSLRSGVQRWSSLLGAVVGPMAFVWLIAAGAWVVGLTLKVQVLDLLGSLLMGLVLIGGVIAAVVMAAYALGQSLLIPAVACEGSDGFDAVQRAYAYTIARPGRLAGYTAIAAVQGLIAYTVVWSLAALAMGMVHDMTGVPAAHMKDTTSPQPAWVTRASGTMPESMKPDLGTRATTPAAAPTSTDSPAETDSAKSGPPSKEAVSIVNFFCSALLALVMAYGISFYFTASTLLYLVMRQVVDDQDFNELWMPGLVDATLARSDAPSPVKPGMPPSTAGTAFAQPPAVTPQSPPPPTA